MCTAAFKIVVTKRPVSGEVIGYRMVLAVPNRAQYNLRTKDYEQSFAGRFRITESGDYTEEPTPRQVAEFLDKAMGWHHITRLC